ncbi:hypothetical protein SmJEL517_g06186 [Synchytrium microbalum]|uniref:ATP-dependent RNA helicase DBP5 n=1 Tax=Synchytrium microbalum TaxID=1806994 RepID=A0A507BWQ1_9FUNG|nr:uncharacterized protein SmJEL517_g06186 [Synchytrium microbalum]TPX30196.1 hypothetical protein SmJEL517_g06186 [Synchytrium microbalum]
MSTSNTPNGTEAVDKLADGIAQVNTEEATKHSALVQQDDEYEVEVELNDASAAGAANPLYVGVTRFEDLPLHPNLLKGVYAMGFSRPSKIQERALPLLLATPPRNMIGQSQSGTGKTAAFVLTMLSRIDYSVDRPQALCLAPSRELAAQIMRVVTGMGEYTGVKTAFAVRDIDRNTAITAQLIIGTPGTVMDLMRKRSLDTSKINIFVLDEADNMLDQQGLGDQSLRIRQAMPRTAQILLFSATFTPEIREFATKFAPQADIISLKQEELSVDGIKQFYMDCKDENHKIEVLQAIYGLMTIGQSIIFVRRRDTADLLSKRMTEEGHTVIHLHGGMSAEDRDKVMDDFRKGRAKVLISTNVIARGIDVLQVTLVVNFDMPLDGRNNPDPETYLHRIGRTGRFGRTGVAINFVHDQRSYNEMLAIQNHFKREIVHVPTNDYMEVEKLLKKAIK